MDNLNNVDNFVSKVKMNKEKQEDIDLFSFKTIILDADETIWDITTPDGIGIPAKDTVPPYIKNTNNSNEIIDSSNNKIILKDGFMRTLHQLALKGKDLYIVSYSDKKGISINEQPLVLILKEFGIFDLFNDVIIDDETPKSEYVLDIDTGNSVFIDDNKKNLIDVSIHTDVETFDSKEKDSVFSWYMNAIVSEAQTIDFDYEEIRKKIEQDFKYAKDDIFTLRDDEGQLKFRVNLNKKEVIQVNPEFRKINPKVYDGLKVPKRITDKLQEINKEKLNHFRYRMKALEDNFKPVSESYKNIDELLTDSDIIKSKITEKKLIDNNNVDENKLEEFLNELDVFSKFIAGVAESFLHFKDGYKINDIEARTLAEQIANKEVFGNFNGEEKFRQENNIDFIPIEEKTSYINPKNLLKNKVKDFESEDISLLNNNIESQISKMNLWIEQGMYIYENKSTKEFSKPFKNKFGFFIEQCAIVDSLTEKIYTKMKQIAGDFVQ